MCLCAVTQTPPFSEEKDHYFCKEVFLSKHHLILQNKRWSTTTKIWWNSFFFYIRVLVDGKREGSLFYVLLSGLKKKPTENATTTTTILQRNPNFDSILPKKNPTAICYLWRQISNTSITEKSIFIPHCSISAIYLNVQTISILHFSKTRRSF